MFATLCAAHLGIPSVIVELAKALHTTPNYLLLGDVDEDDWMDDMIQILKEINDKNLHEIAIKQMSMLAEI